MSLGFKKAGFNVICSVEIERHAAETYSKNFPSAKMLNQDISSIKADYLLNLSAQRGINSLVVIGDLCVPPPFHILAIGLFKTDLTDLRYY